MADLTIKLAAFCTPGDYKMRPLDTIYSIFKLIPMELYRQNRSKLIASMWQHLQAQGLPINGVVFLQGGEEQKGYCTNSLILFRQESYLAYLFVVKEQAIYRSIGISIEESNLTVTHGIYLAVFT